MIEFADVIKNTKDFNVLYQYLNKADSHISLFGTRKVEVSKFSGSVSVAVLARKFSEIVKATEGNWDLETRRTGLDCIERLEHLHKRAVSSEGKDLLGKLVLKVSLFIERFLDFITGGICGLPGYLHPRKSSMYYAKQIEARKLLHYTEIEFQKDFGKDKVFPCEDSFCEKHSKKRNPTATCYGVDLTKDYIRGDTTKEKVR